MTYGVLAEFADAERLLAVAESCNRRGFRRVEAYSPFPIDGLAEALGCRRTPVSLMALLGGLFGGTLGYGIQYYSSVIDYPVNAGGRPLHSWPAFIPVTFELAVLGAALAVFFGMLILNGLPRLYHPLQAVKEFDLATRNRFFLCIRASDPQFHKARAFLLHERPLAVFEAP